jgi:hypothetical protein
MSCPLCESEDDWHFIYGCEYNRNAWLAAGLYNVIEPYIQQEISAKEVIIKLCRHCDRDDAAKAAVLVWILWQNRNNYLWNQEKDDGQHLGYKALLTWTDWRAVQRAYNIGVQQVQQQQLSWQPPPSGKYKYNIDVGVHEDARKTSAGWCVRDHRGYFVLGGSSWIDGRCSSNEGEALALLEAMKELQQRGFNNVIFETDLKT